MKIIIFILLLIPFTVVAGVESLKWYLKPMNQNVQVDIDDLHQETIVADSKLDWGYDLIKYIKTVKPVRIAIIDGGVDIEHPDLKDYMHFNTSECFEGTIIPPMAGASDHDQNGYLADCVGWNFVGDNNRVEDEDGHGTHVAGILASIIGKHKHNIKIIPLKVFAPNEGKSNIPGLPPLPVRLIKAFEYAINMKADIIHISAGWPKNYMTSSLANIISAAIKQNIMIVTAAGNSSQRSAIYPCQIDGVICVGALRADGTIARFSNFGNQVDLFAYGEQILSSIPINLIPQHISIRNYDYKNGTSQAAPFITALVSLLKSSFGSEDNQDIYARIMNAAQNAIGYSGQRGMFNLKIAFENKPKSFLYPNVKGLHTVTINKDDQFSLSIPLVNYGKNQASIPSLSIACNQADADIEILGSNPIKSTQKVNVLIKGHLTSSYLNDLRCFLKINEKLMPLVLKIVRPLPLASIVDTVVQNERIISVSNNQARSRLLTIPTLKREVPDPLYQVAGVKNFKVMRYNKLVGEIIPHENCRVLRSWQVDLNGDFKKDILIEYMCDKKYLQYRFFNQDLLEIFDAVTFFPNKTLINYSDFEILLNQDLPPSFRFINIGYKNKPVSPWEEDDSEERLPHLYQLDPIKLNGKYEYATSILDNPGLWSETLGLLYTPGYNIYYIFKDKMLVDLNQKYAWVDLKTQTATWASMDQLLLKGSKLEWIQSTNEIIFQSLLTPYQYRGAIDGKKMLRYRQPDIHDPIFQIITTNAMNGGYQSVLQTYRYLLYLKFNQSGELIEENKIPIDRFDFLTSQDMMAAVNHVQFKGKDYQIIDGSNINTNYVDVISNGLKQSFELPSHCVSNMPIQFEKQIYLPVYCHLDESHFELNYILLSN